jgi:shikimate kinase
MKFSRDKIRSIIKEEVSRVNETHASDAESRMEIVSRNLDEIISSANELKLELERKGTLPDKSGTCEDQSAVAASLVKALLRMTMEEEEIR